MSFLNELRTSFESGDVDTLDPVTLDELSDSDTHAVREAQAETSKELSEDLTDSISQSKVASKVILGTISAVEELRDVSPAMLASAVSTVNNQVADTASVLGVQPPNKVEMNDETYELDQVSMEGVSDWLKKLWKSFTDALAKLSYRVKNMFTRLRLTSVGLDNRIKRTNGMLRRRSNPQGGKEISLKTAYLERLISGSDLSTSPLDELKTIGELLEAIVKNTAPATKELSIKLTELLGFIVVGGSSSSNVGANLDVNALNKFYSDLTKANVNYIGNKVFKLHSSKALIPSGVFVKGTPDPETIAKRLRVVPSLSNEAIVTLLDGVHLEINNRMVSLEDDLDAMYAEMANLMHGAEEIWMSASENMFSNKDRQIENFMDSYIEDYYMAVDRLYDNYSYYLQIADAVIAYAEESILKD